LLVKKLEDLSPPTTHDEVDQFDFYAQHLERPLTMANMDAITVLIEVGQQKNKKKRGKITKVGYGNILSGLMEVLVGS